MKILIAEDDPSFQRILHYLLVRDGHDVQMVEDGEAALAALLAPTEDGPYLALLDWMMPRMDGIEVCRQVRTTNLTIPPYLILITSRDNMDDRILGLDSGADDYLTKPFDHGELRARIRVGLRFTALQMERAEREKERMERVKQLEEALAQVHHLQGLLPICSYCKKIRDDRNYWQQVEGYIAKHTAARFTHSICPECYEQIVGPELQKMNLPENKHLLRPLDES
jgi:CheY-like chemotaxis protein